MSTEAEYVEDAISNCCGASVFEPDVCADCLEHCGLEELGEPDEPQYNPVMKEYTRRIAEALNVKR